MENRDAKVIVNKAGGNAGTDSVRYKVMLPTAWVKELGVSAENPKLELSFDGNSITIKKKIEVSADNFCKKAKAAKHHVKKYDYYNLNNLCSTIYADFTEQVILVENFTDNVIQTAFGRTTQPSWEQFIDFLEDRCVPRTRAGISDILQAMGLNEYDPIKIVEKTQGHMAEDKQWLSVSEV